jgi:hypothetical protein
MLIYAGARSQESGVRIKQKTEDESKKQGLWKSRSQESEVRSQNKTEGKRRKQKQRMRGQNENRKTGK